MSTAFKDLPVALAGEHVLFELARTEQVAKLLQQLANAESVAAKRMELLHEKHLRLSDGTPPCADAITPLLEVLESRKQVSTKASQAALRSATALAEFVSAARYTVTDCMTKQLPPTAPAAAPAQAPLQVCEECEQADARWACEECGQGLCASCNEDVHNKGKRALHQREEIKPAPPPPPKPDFSAILLDLQKEEESRLRLFPSQLLGFVQALSSALAEQLPAVESAAHALQAALEGDAVSTEGAAASEGLLSPASAEKARSRQMATVLEWEAKQWQQEAQRGQAVPALSLFLPVSPTSVDLNDLASPEPGNRVHDFPLEGMGAEGAEHAEEEGKERKSPRMVIAELQAMVSQQALVIAKLQRLQKKNDQTEGDSSDDEEGGDAPVAATTVLKRKHNMLVPNPPPRPDVQRLNSPAPAGIAVTPFPPASSPPPTAPRPAALNLGTLQSNLASPVSKANLPVSPEKTKPAPPQPPNRANAIMASGAIYAPPAGLPPPKVKQQLSELEDVERVQSVSQDMGLVILPELKQKENGEEEAFTPFSINSAGGSALSPVLLAGVDMTFLQEARRGVELLKFKRGAQNRQGKPHAKTFVFEEGAGELSWGPKAHNRLCLAEALEVCEGKKTPVLSKAAAAKEELCFSIVTSDRSVDLQADSPEQRQLWVASLRQLMLHYRQSALGEQQPHSALAAPQRAQQGWVDKEEDLVLDAEWETAAMNGVEFLKHKLGKAGVQGKPHLKTFALDIKSGLLSWGAKSHNQLLLAEAVQITLGKLTPVFPKSTRTAPPELCFSIILPDRSIDLQADNAAQAELWVKNLRRLHKALQRQDGNGQHENKKGEEKTASSVSRFARFRKKSAVEGQKGGASAAASSGTSEDERAPHVAGADDNDEPAPLTHMTKARPKNARGKARRAVTPTAFDPNNTSVFTFEAAGDKDSSEAKEHAAQTGLTAEAEVAREQDKDKDKDKQHSAGAEQSEQPDTAHDNVVASKAKAVRQPPARKRVWVPPRAVSGGDGDEPSPRALPLSPLQTSNTSSAALPLSSRAVSVAASQLQQADSVSSLDGSEEGSPGPGFALPVPPPAPVDRLDKENDPAQQPVSSVLDHDANASASADKAGPPRPKLPPPVPGPSRGLKKAPPRVKPPPPAVSN